MTLSVEKIKQIREMAKEGRRKTYIARMIGCNRKTVHSYWPKTEEEKKPELSKRIFQMLEEGCSPVKVVVEVGYPAYVQKQVKSFKRFKQQELNRFLAEIDDTSKILAALKAKIKELEENKEKEEATAHKLIVKKGELQVEISHQENLLSSLRRKIEEVKNKYSRLKFDWKLKEDLSFFHKFLENPRTVPTRTVATIVGIVMDAFYQWATLENNKNIFSGPEFFPLSAPQGTRDLVEALHILSKKFYNIVPQNLRELLVEEILRKEIPDSLKQLAIKEGYEETVKTLTHYPCSICGKDMIMSKEQLREAVTGQGWAHNSCIKQKRNKVSSEDTL